jgi:hypothetical protein
MSISQEPPRQSSPPLLLDMVHHNPGEPPFETKFLEPKFLAECGYNGQVFKHLNCAIRFDSIAPNLFASGTEAGKWMEQIRSRIKEEIRRAKSAGLQILYHIDLFVLPRDLVEAEREGLCGLDGRISVDQDRTLEIHKILFDEMFRDFPEVDGLIIRTGETYLLDTPHHTGNGPVQFHSVPVNLQREKERFVKLINFLREEICVRHNRKLIYRTWDVLPDRFHASADYYQEVTNQVEPHPNLLFSIKHTTLDFFRRVPFNPALGTGRHPQIVEVQCQREYEGKGAHPNYVMDGVINGFEEEKTAGTGLAQFSKHPLYAGIYTWSRGGGWFGPYLKNEFWCELNARVIAAWANDPAQTEEAVFLREAARLGMDEENAARFRKLALLSARGVLKGRYCEVRKLALCWMRDQNIGGLDQLEHDFEFLGGNNLFEEALREKEESVTIWNEAEKLAKTIQTANPALDQHIQVSTTYGRILYSIVCTGWKIMAAGWQSEHGQTVNRETIAPLFQTYDALWTEFRTLAENHSQCATLYTSDYWSWPGQPPAPGLGASVEKFRKLFAPAESLPPA